MIREKDSILENTYQENMNSKDLTYHALFTTHGDRTSQGSHMETNLVTPWSFIVFFAGLIKMKPATTMSEATSQINLFNNPI